MADNPEQAAANARRMAAEALAGGDATGWFEKLYAAAGRHEAEVPWDRGGDPNPLLAGWFDLDGRNGDGLTALVIGSGMGDDAELVARRGFRTTAFDIAPTAIRAARERHPGSAVRYVVADLLDPPAEWRDGFALVIESMTVQSLPRSLRDRAIEAVRSFVAPGGTLLVIAFALRNGDSAGESGPPWPLTGEELAQFAAGSLRQSETELVVREDGAEIWRARFDATGGGAPTG
jgi:hypothetical protein